MEPIVNLLSTFSPITLEELNNSMSLMDRVESKYMLSFEQLPAIIKEMENFYSVLTIDDKTVFTYDNVYMDTPDYFFYNQHQSSEKFRTKIRTRRYVESNLHYFEFKQRTDEAIRKFRYKSNAEDHGKMTQEGIKFFEGIFHNMYGYYFARPIGPALRNQYTRFTLCNKRSAERVTVDFHLTFLDERLDNPALKPVIINNLVILETKSETKQCLSRDILKNHNIQPAKSCSKYCFGLSYFGNVENASHFEEPIAAINQIEGRIVAPTLQPSQAEPSVPHHERSSQPVAGSSILLSA